MSVKRQKGQWRLEHCKLLYKRLYELQLFKKCMTESTFEVLFLFPSYPVQSTAESG